MSDLSRSAEPVKKFLLLPAAFLLVLLYAPRAQALSEQCEAVLELPSVSQHYTRKVLERAEAGLLYSQTAAQNPDFEQYLPDWAREVGSAWAKLLDSELRVSQQQQGLLNQTACLRFDLLQIECMMDKVRDEMNAQIDRGSFLAIMRLQSLLQFLNERYRHLENGALEPEYSDPTWGKKGWFDSPAQVWCCPETIPGNVCTQVSQETCNAGDGLGFESLPQCVTWGCVPPGPIPEDTIMCPYNADYSPPFIDGFGCDLETMEPLTSFVPLKDEYDALKVINEEVTEYRESAAEFLEVQRKIDEIFERASTVPDPPEPREHLEAYNCALPGGYCENEITKRCMRDSECSSGTCRTPTWVCSENRTRKCFDDAHCTGYGTCLMDEESPDPFSSELRGPFSVDKNNIKILSEFLALRTDEGLSREFSDMLKIPSEFSAEKAQEKADREMHQGSVIERLMRNSIRMMYTTWSRLQGREEAAIFPEAVDAQLEVANSLTLLRTAVSDISKLAHDKDGLRRFVIRYAYFLRRTCTNRPCSLSLEQVLKIALADECFPYTNGDYLSDTPDDTRAQKCKEAAGL